jgi:Xaa-Pro aminopeptidase
MFQAPFHAQFQTFDDRAETGATPHRLAALRAALKARSADGFILPRADRQQNEYVPPAEERLAWLTGFTGSAGVVVILPDKAALFVDGRYTLQAREEVDGALFAIEHLTETPPHVWIERNLAAGHRLGFDPWLHTADGAERLTKACAAAGASLVPLDPDPVDAIWSERPEPPLGPVVLHDTRYAGEDAAAKIARAQAEIATLRADILVVSDPHNVAWLFNIRGSDVAHTPLPLSFATLGRTGRPALYVDGRKLTNKVRDALEQICDLREPNALTQDLAALTANGKAIRFDQATAADALVRIVREAGGKPTRGADPLTLMKAVKTHAEIEGARAAHRRDGAAMARFLAWFDREAPGGALTEIDAVEALETFRRDTGLLKDVSFPTISGSGPNGAIVHYRVTRKTNRTIRRGDLMLIDSGAQYEDGTTDITRTLPVGAPSEEMRAHFTLVLKGHIAVARAIFPEGTTGAQLDTLARQYLWQAGLDFDHGTGHGVGSYLSVHEGPARISKLGTVPLQPGMILSNEPGYYKTGAYGIRIENLVLVTRSAAVEGAEKTLNTFETLTLAPIDRRLIDPTLMTIGEIAWLDAYHAQVAETIAPLVDKQTEEWLRAMTQPLL